LECAGKTKKVTTETSGQHANAAAVPRFITTHHQAMLVQLIGVAVQIVNHRVWWLE